MCEKCNNTGWVCEFCGTQWELENGETCCGAGNNCTCNPNGSYSFDIIIASINQDDEITPVH